MKFSSALVVLFFGSLLSLNAQYKNEIQFGLATPQGDFAELDKTYAIFYGSGYAADGIYLNYKSLSSFASKNLFWTLSAGISYNKLDRSYETYFENEIQNLIDQTNGYYNVFNVQFPKYLNIPILAGLQYEQPITDKFKLYGEIGLGFNTLMMNDFIINVEDIKMSYNFEPSVKVAYKFGIGAIIRDRFTINLTYLSLGSNAVKYTFDAPNTNEDGVFDPSLNVSTLNVALGYRF